jgi:hypothetical protein
MRLMVEMIIGGWAITIVMFVLCGLNEGGQLTALRRKLVSVLEYWASVLRVPEDFVQSKPQA